MRVFFWLGPILAFWISTSALGSVEFLNLFKNKKPVVAAIMISIDWKTHDDFLKSQAWAIEQARIASDGGMDGILVEFRGGEILDRLLAKSDLEKMSALTKAVISSTPLVVGVEILWHFPGSTLWLAKESGAKFVRLDFFSDEVIANKMRVPIDPKALMEFRQKMNAQSVAILTDIQVKYSKMIDPSIPIQRSAVKAQTFGSDGVIVSGSKSGSSPDVAKIRKTRTKELSIPVIIGSGFSQENAEKLLPHLDAIIVGTSVSQKTGGPLLKDKVTELMTIVKKSRH